MRTAAPLSKALFVVFILLLTAVVYAIGTKSVPLWGYVLIATSLGLVVSLILLLSRDTPKKEVFFTVALLFIILLNFHALATRHSLLFAYDTYSEYVHLRLLQDQGYFELGRTYPDLTRSVNPSLTPNYPLLAILGAAIGSTAHLEPMGVALILPMIFGLVAILAVVLIARLLSAGRKNAHIVIGLVAIVFLTSPDMMYFSSNFYHRGLSLSLLFLTLYLAMKYWLSGARSLGLATLLSLLLTTAPLAYSYYPNVYAVFFLWFALLTAVVKLSKASPHVNALRVPIIFFLLIFIAGFLWNFMLLLSSSPLTRTLPKYAFDLATFNIGAKELVKIDEQALPAIPEVLRPVPWTYMLHFRDLLLLSPVIVLGIWLVSKFFGGKLTRKEDLALLVAGASFVPLVITDYLSGWRPSNALFYAFPLIGYSVALALARLCRAKKGSLRGISVALITFLVAMAFVSPFWHIYYPRQLYDPNIDWQDVGFPNPSYRHLGAFLESHPLGEGYILSDQARLLAVTLPLDDLSKVRELPDRFGYSNTYVIVFIGIQPRLGYNPPGTGEVMGNVRGEIDHTHSKVVDAGPYTIYLRGG